MTATTIARLKAIFNEIQTCDIRTYSEHARIAAELLSSHENFPPFQSILAILLLTAKQEIPKRINTFIKKIISDLRGSKTGLEFVSWLYSFLLSKIDCKSRKVRRSILILLQLVGEINEQDIGKVSEKLFDKDRCVRKECVKLLKPYQHLYLNQKTSILSLFKDLVRYDPSPEVRREVLRSVEIDSKLYNYVIIGCEDTSETIRRVFYNETLNLIVLKELSKEKRVQLLKKSFSEREFDAKGFFLRKCMREYAEPEIKQLAEDFYDESNLCYLDELLRHYFPTTSLIFDSAYLESITQPSSHLLLQYLKFVEEELGREILALMPLGLYLEFLYKICCKCLDDKSCILVARNLFNILRFYEMFEEESQRIIQSTVYKMLGKNFIWEIVDDVVSLPSISSNTLFMGTLIKKNMGSDNVLLLCRSILKNIKPFSELHYAISREILSKHKDFQNQFMVLELMFFYCLEKPDAKYLEILMENITETFPFLVDLYLSDNKDVQLKERLFKYINSQIRNECIAIPASKIMLFDGTDQFLEFVVETYYITNNDEIKQYLTVFFREYFRRFSKILISRFCDVLCCLTANHKLWADQSVYWLQNSENPSTSEFIYNICIFMHKNKDLHKKLLVNLLGLLDIDGKDQARVKKIIHCCTLLLKRGVNVSGLIGKAMIVDDGDPIDKDTLEDLRKDIGIVIN